MNKLDVIASIVEGETLCSFPILLEDEYFLEKFKKLLKSKMKTLDIANELIKIANEIS
jgi:hypothetical protein